MRLKQVGEIKMKKYGLQLRIPPDQQKKIASKPPRCPPSSIFGNDDDDDDVTKEISRQASKSRALQMIDEQQKKALEEDPLAFGYDEVYDEMKSNAARSRVQDQSKREPKYITSIIESAKKREHEHEIVYERKLLKERSKEDHLYEDKEKFVTSAYKKKLAERANWLEEERLRELHEAKDDVTKKSDLTDFYFSLNKNIAFGAESVKRSKEQSISICGRTEGSLSKVAADMHSKVDREQANEQASHASASVSSPIGANDEAISATSNVDNKHTTSDQDKVTLSAKAVSGEKKSDQATGSSMDAERFKRSENTISAARERFLARKKAREQL
ncbi:hypothetical protein HPP92_020896 [Vanilla planifolia]|uniref:Nuclear speckle splicing regulatory protein 1 N-terminal domain-containing protein n=1 Tax=Vanilla planifolia TaxID=51239 RepID=A0A835Q1B8_VANPL|nr:hypothetical protein HPP92_020896 [Vanilla planifolia]